MTPEQRNELRRRIAEQRRKRRLRLLLRRIAVTVVILVVGVIILPKVMTWGYDKVMGVCQNLGKEDGDDKNDSHSGSIQDSAQVSVLPQGNVDPQIMAVLRERYQEQENASSILDNPASYPDALLALLAKRPETLDFVLGYPQNKGISSKIDLTGQMKKGKFPRLYQWDQRWGYASYGNNIMALAGCGPTCLSMVALGLTGDAKWDPLSVARLSEDNGYVSEVGTSWELMTVGAAQMGLQGRELPLDEGKMIEHLEEGYPIICSMRPGDFTDTGHFIVLTEYRSTGFVINDPNSIGNSEKIWTYEEIRGQIRNLWAFSPQ